MRAIFLLFILLGTTRVFCAAVQAESGIERIKSQFLSQAGSVGADSEAADVQLVCLNSIFWEWGQHYLSIIEKTPDLPQTQIASFTAFVAGLTQAKSENQLNYDKVRPGIVEKIKVFIDEKRGADKWPASAIVSDIKLADIKDKTYIANLESCQDPTFYKGIDAKLDRRYDDIVDKEFTFKLFTIENMEAKCVPNGKRFYFEAMGAVISRDFDPGKARAAVREEKRLSEPKEEKMSLRNFIEKQRQGKGK